MTHNAHECLRIKVMIVLSAVGITAVPCMLPAQETTTVADTLHDPSGLPLNGRLVITNQTAFLSADGFEIPAGNQITVNVTDGSFSVQLVPNIGATPSGTNYSVAYYLPNRRGTETWVVPQTPNPANLANVRALTPPIPSTQLAIAQVNPPSPCTPSSFLAWQGAGWNCAQPAFSSLSGVASPDQLPSASAMTRGILQLAGDLDGSAAIPQVTSTHLAGALPVSQGGTGTEISFAPGEVVFAASGGAYTQDSQFFWDGNNHRLGLGTNNPGQTLEVNGGARLNTAATQPTCNPAQRGTFWVTQGGTGVNDAVQVCVKNAADVYAWRDVFTSARMFWSAFIPGNIPAGAGWDFLALDQPITVTRLEIANWNLPNCTVSPTITVTDNVSPITLTVNNNAYYSTATFAQNYAAGTLLRINTTGGTCSTYPTNVSIHVDYQMQ